MTIRVLQTREGKKKYFHLEVYRQNDKKMGCHINIDDDFNASLHCSKKCIISLDEIQCIQQAMSEYKLRRKFERETNKKIDPNGIPNMREGSVSYIRPLSKCNA